MEDPDNHALFTTKRATAKGGQQKFGTANVEGLQHFMKMSKAIKKNLAKNLEKVVAKEEELKEHLRSKLKITTKQRKKTTEKRGNKRVRVDRELKPRRKQRVCMDLSDSETEKDEGDEEEQGS